MQNNRDISIMWVSLAARGAWHSQLVSLGKTILETTLAGTHQGVWTSRSLNLYGNLWPIFLSSVKKYNVSYTSTTVKNSSATARLCHTVQINNASFNQTNAVPNADTSLPTLSFWDIASRSAKSQFKTKTLIEHEQTAVSMLLWEDVGLSLFAEVPESLACKKSGDLVESHLDWMDESGYAGDAALLREMLSWPLEWSSLHGIEELRTPLFKLQATNWSKLYHPARCVQIQGTRYPAEGAVGLQFPYQQKAFRSISDSTSFKKGIIHNTCTK